MCILAENCDEPNYINLINALCNMRGVKLIKVKDNKELGKWAGLCKVDKKGEARKIVRTSVVVITVILVVLIIFRTSARRPHISIGYRMSISQLLPFKNKYFSHSEH